MRQEFARFLGEINQNRAAFEHIQRTSLRFFVDDRWDLRVRVYFFYKPFLLQYIGLIPMEEHQPAQNKVPGTECLWKYRSYEHRMRGPSLQGRW